MSTATEATRVLRRFKNAILEGPPGTGKTHVVAAIADGWQKATGRPLLGDGSGRYAITFHPSTTYEEFVEGLRYDDATGEFKRRDGFLRLIIEEAEKDPDSDFLVLLDEVNRANVPKVLGDVLLCMESTKRSTFKGSGWTDGQEVTLPYSGDLFSIPDNIYLLGTMNTSDRSIAPLDSALRRRFGFVRVNPIVGDDLNARIAEVDGPEAAAAMASSVDSMTNLNAALVDALGPDAAIGHSYFFGAATSVPAASADVSDPLDAVRSTAANVKATGAFWLEVATTNGGAGNQIDIPDARPATSNGPAKQGLRHCFYPMASAGNTTNTPSPPGTQDPVDLHFRAAQLVRNTLEYNSGGSNYRFKYQGKTADDRGIHSFTPQGSLAQKVHVYVRRPDNTLDLILLDREPEVITALLSVTPDVERTMTGASGRYYGPIDMDALLEQGGAEERTVEEDAVWMIWRYAVLPQLVDMATQLGVPDLLDPLTRDSALDHLEKPELANRFETFDQFLAEHSLYLSIEGHGLSRGIVISDHPRHATPTNAEDTATPDVDVQDEDA